MEHGLQIFGRKVYWLELLFLIVCVDKNILYVKYMDKIRTFQSFKMSKNSLPVPLTRKWLESALKGMTMKEEDEGSRKHAPVEGREWGVLEMKGESHPWQGASYLWSREQTVSAGTGETPKGCIQDWSETDRLPKVFELTKRRLTTLWEGLRVN